MLLDQNMAAGKVFCHSYVMVVCANAGLEFRDCRRAAGDIAVDLVIGRDKDGRNLLIRL